MKYMGSKNRIAKDIVPFIMESLSLKQYYVEPFVGGCNMIDKIGGYSIGADNNLFLIEMWKKLQQGWIPPKEITRETYNKYRTMYNTGSYTKEDESMIGYVGFNGSYGGRFFDGGYAGITTTKQGKIRNYPLEAYNNIMKQVKNIKNVKFIHSDYQALEIPKDSVIYCDPPYADTKKYKSAKDFNIEAFWQWCRDKKSEGHQIFISEYKAPDDFKCIWQKEVKSSLSANGKIGGNKNSIERLFTL